MSKPTAPELKAPPYSMEAEMSVIGSMLIDKQAVEFAMEKLTSDSFYDEKTRTAFRAMTEMQKDGKTIDIVTLADELKRQSLLEKVGNAEFLTETMNMVPTAAHIEAYVRIVTEMETLRGLVDAAIEISQKCYLRFDEPEEILDFAEKKVFAIAERQLKQGIEPVQPAVTEMMDLVEHLYEKKRPIGGLTTGFYKLDKCTTGFQPGNFIVLAARPGMGKTAFALNILDHVTVVKKTPALFYSLEMTKQEIMFRMVSARANVNLGRLRTGFFLKEQWGPLTKSFEEIYEAPLYFDFSGAGSSILTLRASARRLASKLRSEGKQLGFIVIDYLQLMHGSGKRSDNRQQEVAEISRGLKGLALDLQVPVMALSQLNRSPEEHGRGGRPQLAHLRESGNIEADADIVMFIWREALYKKAEAVSDELMREAKLLIAKHRNGPTGDIELNFIKECVKFTSVDKTLQDTAERQEVEQNASSES